MCAFHRYHRDECQSLSFPWSPWEAPQQSVRMVLPDVLVPGATQMAKQGIWPDGSGSAVQPPTHQFYITWSLVSQNGVWVSSIPYTELQLLHHWGHLHNRNLSAWFETELLIFPNLRGVVRNLHAWYGFPKAVPLWITSICWFLHLQIVLSMWFALWGRSNRI